MSEAQAPPQLPMARPVIGEREEELVLEVLRSGMLSLGPMLTRFERDLSHLMRLLDRLDRFALANARPVTVPLLRQMLQEEGTDASDTAADAVDPPAAPLAHAR